MAEETKTIEKQEHRLSDGSPENGISSTLIIIGWAILILGIVAGLWLGTDRTGYSTEFSFTIFIIYAATGIVSGMLIVGLGEVIKQLFSINHRLKENGFKFKHKKDL